MSSKSYSPEELAAKLAKFEEMEDSSQEAEFIRLLERSTPDEAQKIIGSMAHHVLDAGASDNAAALREITSKLQRWFATNADEEGKHAYGEFTNQMQNLLHDYNESFRLLEEARRKAKDEFIGSAKITLQFMSGTTPVTDATGIVKVKGPDNKQVSEDHFAGTYAKDFSISLHTGSLHVTIKDWLIAGYIDKDRTTEEHKFKTAQESADIPLYLAAGKGSSSTIIVKLVKRGEDEETKKREKEAEKGKKELEKADEDRGEGSAAWRWPEKTEKAVTALLHESEKISDPRSLYTTDAEYQEYVIEKEFLKELEKGFGKSEQAAQARREFWVKGNSGDTRYTNDGVVRAYAAVFFAVKKAGGKA